MSAAHNVTNHVFNHNTSNALEVFKKQKSDFYCTTFWDLKTRLNLLIKLKKVLQQNHKELVNAIVNDFGAKSRYETYLAEIYLNIRNINYITKNLKSWMKKKRKGIPVYMLPGKAYVTPTPLGVVGIIAPWNYPLFLTISPIAYAIAAGNRVMVKMSELTPETSLLMQKLIHDNFDENHLTIINGGPEVAKEFSEIPFDHLMFTGSTEKGRMVMQAASKNLTPVTLELGGKSPAIFSKNSINDKNIEKLLYGKFINSGQTCVSPDYALIPEDNLRDFTSLIKKVTNKFYPNFDTNKDYTNIINNDHVSRLSELISNAKSNGAEVIGLIDDNIINSGNKFYPFLVVNPSESSKIMQEEIFGPILVVKTYKNFDHAKEIINLNPNPLAVYYFGEDNNEKNYVINSIPSGGICLNDTVLQVCAETLPFGGIGNSGIGQYHGIEGFYNFSKLKPIYEQSKLAIGIFPPYRLLSKLFLSLVLKIKVSL